jgi:heat shock protein HtpX
MLVTLVMVVLLPVGFAYALVYLVNTVGIQLLRFATNDPWAGRFYVEWYLVAGLVVAGFALQYLLGAWGAKRAVDARPVGESEYPELHSTVGRVARTFDLRKPDVAVAESPVPNAFTVGARPSAATVVVTDSLLETLSDEQREAVIAHELSHVRNRDVGVMTLAYFLPSFTYFVATGAFFLLVATFRGLGNLNHVDDEGAKGVVVVFVVLVVSALSTLFLSAVFWVLSFLLFRILSRYREYVADRGAAVATGNPAALASALEKLDDEMAGVPDEDLRAADGGIEALYVAPIDSYQFGEDRELISSDVFPATHPPVADRIERLRDLQREVEQA